MFVDVGKVENKDAANFSISLPDDTEFRNDLKDETENRIPVVVNGSSVSNYIDHGLYSNEFYYPTAHHTQYSGGNFSYVYNVNNYYNSS